MVTNTDRNSLIKAGLNAYSIESKHRLNSVLNAVGEDTRDELNFKKSLTSFKRHVKSLADGDNSVTPLSLILGYAGPLLEKSFNYYNNNPESLTGVIDSINDSKGIDVRKFGVNELIIGEFMRQSTQGGYKDGLDFLSDSVLGNLGTIPRLYVQDKIRTFSKEIKNSKDNKTIEESKADEFGLQLSLTADKYGVSVKELLTVKELSPHLSQAYLETYGVSGIDYATRQRNVSSIGYTGVRLLDEFKDSFIKHDLSDVLKSFKPQGEGLFAALIGDQIDSVAKKNLVPSLNDYSTLAKSFGKNNLDMSVNYVKHFE